METTTPTSLKYLLSGILQEKFARQMKDIQQMSMKIRKVKHVFTINYFGRKY